MKYFILFFIFLLLLSGSFLIGYYTAKFLEESKVCEISLKEGLDLLYKDFPDKTVYYKNYAFIPLKNKSIVIKRIKK